MKLEKKKFLECPNCGKFTRAIQYLKQYGALRTLTVPAPFLSDALGTKTAKKCQHCGNANGLKKHFLETEVDEKGKEVSFITPKGEKVTMETSS